MGYWILGGLGLLLYIFAVRLENKKVGAKFNSKDIPEKDIPIIQDKKTLIDIEEKEIEIIVVKIVNGQRILTDRSITISETFYNSLCELPTFGFYYMDDEDIIYTPSLIQIIDWQTMALNRNTEAINKNRIAREKDKNI